MRSATKNKRLMLFEEIIAAHSENQEQYIHYARTFQSF
jgi:hypothetical protein